MGDALEHRTTGDKRSFIDEYLEDIYMTNRANKEVKDIIIEAFDKMRIHNASRNLTLWAIDLPLALFLADCVKPQWTTLETGCGLTTVALAALGTHHYCVVPSIDEVKRLRAYCESISLPLNRVTFIVERSEDALPKLDLYEFDLSIIDGRHAFPSPFIDFYYMAERLKLGGLLVVDDICIWTGRILSDFLESEKEWDRVKKFHNTIVFEKLSNGTHEKEWNSQPLVIARSRVAVALFHCRQRAHTFIFLLKAKYFKMIYKKIAHRLFRSGRSE